MLAFFRRALGSKIVLGLLGVLLLAFIVTGVTGPGGMSGLTGGPGADSVATVDGRAVSTAEVARRAQDQLAQARQQQPDLDMARFLGASGGVGPLVDQYVSARTLEAWAARHGLVAGDRLVDGEIASIPAFQGPTGRFDEKQMRALLAQQRISEPALREGLRGDLLRRQLLVPISAGTVAGSRLVDPYAGVIVARREGLVGIVPARPDAVAAPTQAEIGGWYTSHIAAYSLPERRVLRYATLAAPPAQPTDADIAAAYKADSAKYAASETRTLSQVVLPTEAAARAFAARVAGGTPFVKAAADAGFPAADIALGAQDRAGFATVTTDAIAAAAFAAPSGGTTQPIHSVLGWHIVHVDAITRKPARTLAEARPEIVAALAKTKQADALATLATKVEDAVADGATFDEVVKANALQVTTTPALTAAGAVPADPAYKADTTVTALLKPGFQMAADDEPTVERTAPDMAVLLDVVRVDAASPVPLAQARDRIVRDMIADRALAAARRTAQSVLDRVAKGEDMAAALAAAGLAPPQTLAASQVELSQMQQVPPAARTLFQLPPGQAAIAPGPNGWLVIKVVKIDAAAPQIRSVIARQMRTELGRVIGDEYVEQFARAVRGEVTVRRNAKALADLGRDLTGQTAGR